MNFRKFHTRHWERVGVWSAGFSGIKLVATAKQDDLLTLGDEMKRLIRRRDMSAFSLARIESPFFALSDVERSLLYPMEIDGLVDLISESGSSIEQCLYEQDKARILEAVSRGDWLLVTNSPFSPLSQDTFGIYSHLTGKSFSLGTPARSPVKLTNDELKQGEPLTMANIMRRANTKASAQFGPGKWVKKEIDYDGISNTLAVLVNRSGSLTDEGRLIFSDGKDFTNTTRTLVQEWVPLANDELSYETGSAMHAYGALRRIKQRFQESEDEWRETGKSWHWVPATADTVYERRSDEK